MWLFFTRRLRMWLILSVVVPVTSGLLRSAGRMLEARTGPSRLSRGLVGAGDLGDRMRSRLTGRSRGA